MKFKLKSGLTLLEVVIAVGIFAILAISGSLILISTLRTSKKAAAVASVRAEGTNILNLMEAHIRFADAITNCAADGSAVTVRNLERQTTTFACIVSGADLYLASNSGRLTTNDLKVDSCANVFTCDAAVPNARGVKISFGLRRVNTENIIESTANIDFNSQVVLRN